ncbi:MAG: prepilin-type N-terminal cleavage/methylation domain-containing protein [Gammaproteobacteria bacterium]|nr:prepilin-type N-terminal cleavage/methylation domain-containing protein [Gammaproteobacteria bacterium]
MNRRDISRLQCRNRFAGFGLIELLVVLFILSLLAAFALPSYQDSVRRSQRGDAYAALATLADALEQAYNNQAAPRSYPTNIVSLGLTTKSAAGYYNLAVAACSDGTLADCYQVTATARSDGPQDSDTKCRTLSMDSRGRRSSSPDSSGCWRK